jgi:hypothetical protein
MDNDELSWMKLLATSAWPVAILAAVALLRTPLGNFFTEVGRGIAGGRGIKIGFAGFSAEVGGGAFAGRQEGKEVQSIGEAHFATEPGQLSPSNVEAIRALVEGAPVEAFTIDMLSGKGTGFLTSRLFLTCRLMARQRQARVVAFVHTHGICEGVYIGACLVDDLERALVARFPEYDAAFALALVRNHWGAVAPSPLQSKVDLGRQGVDDMGRLDPPGVINVCNAFLDAIRDSSTIHATEHDWVQVSPIMFERATWVTRECLLDAVGGGLMLERVNSKQGTFTRLLDASSPYVGLVDERDRLLELIRRASVLEEMARSALNG